jgi:hypothetical protein
MVDTAAWLVDVVIPEVPVRQWVLSLPYRVWALCSYDQAACALVRSVLVRAVTGSTSERREVRVCRGRGVVLWRSRSPAKAGCGKSARPV